MRTRRMMRSPFRMGSRFWLASLLVLLACAGCKQSTEKVREEIQKQIDKNLAAQAAGDSSGFWSIYTDDYTYRAYDGELYTREEASQGFGQAMSQIKMEPDTKVVIDSIDVKADTASVFTKMHFVRRQQGADSVAHLIVSDGAYRQTWVKTPDGWKARYIEEITQGTTMVDGAPIPIDTTGKRFVRAYWDGGLDSLRVVYMEVRAVHPDSIPFEEETLAHLGRKLLQARRVMDALHVFQMITDAYPQSSTAFDNLGEAYVTAGQRELAVRSYERSLQIDRNNENAKDMLKRLGS